MNRSLAAAVLALAPALALCLAPPARAQTREVTFVCQGGGAMLVELTPATTSGQVILIIRAALAAADGEPSSGTCTPRDSKFRDRAQAAASRANNPPGVPIQLRMTTRQTLVLNVEVPADQSPRVTLSSRRTDARAEQALALYQAAVQGRSFTVTVREQRDPLDLAITGSSAR